MEIRKILLEYLFISKYIFIKSKKAFVKIIYSLKLLKFFFTNKFIKKNSLSKNIKKIKSFKYD
jgi:hypothetical protein